MSIIVSLCYCYSIGSKRSFAHVYSFKNIIIQQKYSCKYHNACNGVKRKNKHEKKLTKGLGSYSIQTCDTGHVCFHNLCSLIYSHPRGTGEKMGSQICQVWSLPKGRELKLMQVTVYYKRTLRKHGCKLVLPLHSLCCCHLPRLSLNNRGITECETYSDKSPCTASTEHALLSYSILVPPHGVTVPFRGRLAESQFRPSPSSVTRGLTLYLILQFFITYLLSVRHRARVASTNRHKSDLNFTLRK